MADEIDAILGTAPRTAPRAPAPAPAGDDIDAILGTTPAPAESKPEWLTPGPRKANQRLTDEADVPAGKFRTRDGRLVDNQTADESLAELGTARQKAEDDFQRATTPQKDEGFFKRAFKSVVHGVGALATVGGEVASTKGAALLDPAKRRQALRGLDDVMTLGYGQKLAARVGNELGDAPDVALGPETFGATDAKGESFARAFMDAGGGEPVANTQEADQAAAPAYRTAGQLVGGFAPGAGQLAAKAGGKLVGVPLAKIAPGATGVIASGARGVAQGVGGYEASAPLTAALSAGAEGQRLDVAKEAASDPLGLLMSAGGGAAGETFRAKTLASKGAKARALIETEGQGAKVTPWSPGKGGVFKDELAGLTPDDRGIGAAAKRGASRIADTIEQQFADKNDFEYREAPSAIKAAKSEAKETIQAYGDDAKSVASDAKEAARAARRASRAADIAYRDDIAAAKHAVKTETAERARQILDNIENEHRVETSRPYRALKNEIDSSPEAAAMRDVTPIVKSMNEAINDLETAPHVRAALEQQVKILENYRQWDIPADGPDPSAGPYLLPERQLNGLRRTLMRAAKVGGSDAPGEAEAPLRRAAFVAKEMVDAGPYKALNDLYATGSAKREAARKAVGLPGKPSKSAAADEKRLTSNLRKSIDDETVLPGQARPRATRGTPEGVPEFIEGEPGTVRLAHETMGDIVHGPGAGPAAARAPRRADLPPEADMAAVRAALKAPKAKRDAEMAKIQATLAAAEKRQAAEAAKIQADIAAAEKRQAATTKKVQDAVKAVEADRALLGLNTKIGTRKTDVNQIRLALQRQGENTGTAGGSAGDAPGLAEFVAKHPEMKTASLLPELQRAKADLTFKLTPEHGGLMNRGGGGVVGTAATIAGALAAPQLAIPYLAALNKTAISGRLLTPLARRTDAAGIGARVGAIQGAGPSPDDIALAREIQRLVRIGVPIEIAVARARAEAAARNAPGDVLPTPPALSEPEAVAPPAAPPAPTDDEDDEPAPRRRRVSRDDLDDEDDGADITL